MVFYKNSLKSFGMAEGMAGVGRMLGLGGDHSLPLTANDTAKFAPTWANCLLPEDWCHPCCLLEMFPGPPHEGTSLEGNAWENAQAKAKHGSVVTTKACKIMGFVSFIRYP